MNPALVHPQHGRCIFWIAFMSALAIHLGAVALAKTKSPTSKLEDFASGDLKFAATVAEFGMILRDSEYKGNGSLQQVLEWAQQGKGADVNGYRADFIELVRKAQALKKS